MKISLNNQIIELNEGATVADLLAAHPPQTPFAVAVNTVFTPKNTYAQTLLNAGDCVDIVRPVAGG